MILIKIIVNLPLKLFNSYSSSSVCSIWITFGYLEITDSACNAQSLLWDSEHPQQPSSSLQQNGVHSNNGGGGGGGGVNIISGTVLAASSPRKHSGSLHGQHHHHRTSIITSPTPQPSLPKRSSFSNLQTQHHHSSHHGKGQRRHSTLTQMLVNTSLISRVTDDLPLFTSDSFAVLVRALFNHFGLAQC